MGWLIVCLLITLFHPTSSQAYPTPYDVDGALHRWPISLEKPDVYYRIEAADATLEGYLQGVADESAAIWSAVDGSAVKLKPFDELNSAQITIFYDRSIAGGAKAAGYSIFDKLDEGVPKHCAIYIAVNSGVDPESLNKTTLHELGHCLGLGHTLMPESIMSYNLDKNAFALSVDDRAALARIYPDDSLRPRLAPGCSIQGSAARGSKPGLVFAIILIIPVLFRLAGFMLRSLVRF